MLADIPLVSYKNLLSLTVYTNMDFPAYFKGAREAPLGIIDRAWFEGRLHAHYSGNRYDDDPAWYALTNAVFAAGARLEIAKFGNFQAAHDAAWAYFSNCLSVHNELLYFRTSLMGIQAIVVMV